VGEGADSGSGKTEDSGIAIKLPDRTIEDSDVEQILLDAG
jgi:hypothetical protein